MNHSQKVKDELDHGEWQGIMACSGGLKEEGCRRILLAVYGPIYVLLEEPMDLSNSMFSLLLLSSVFLSDCTMFRVWRAWSTAHGPNHGGHPSKAFPSHEEDSMSHYRGILDASPFNWGDQYMAETPILIEVFIVIMEIDLLQEFEILMGFPLIPNPFWSVHILLACDIQAKIQTAQGIREAMDTIRRGQQESAAGFHLLEKITQNLSGNPDAGPSNLGQTLANSPASTMQPPQEEHPPNLPSEAGS